MHGFVSHYTNKLDAKGRVSIPASFRSVLVRDGFEGLYCFPSPHADTVDAGGNQLLNEISSRLGGLDTLTADHDMISTALFGISELLKLDGEGRVMLTDTLREHTGITNTATFVGLGYKFQIWDPDRFKAHRAEAMKRAFGLFGSSAATGASGGTA
ncbi:division/cell wall cluster transcriptional repressor MraZ [Acuticoccus sp. M5D2P5]|uniref:division/cell wall cluster transcriptional repressor MraZ n=1 Tax=Acuticoccus kalidii TaxID=2910977 RepID=UPI001F236AB3|nr:division/cell wall cluster transcriptional repressor MraZ [Acuticoccus kalidii]